MNKYLKAVFWKALTAMKKAGLFVFCGIGGLAFNKEKELDLRNVRRILVIHGEHSSIGDAVLFSALLAPLRKRFPRAKIDVLIRHPAETILKGNPNVDEFIAYTAEEGTNLITQEFAPLKMVGILKKRKYDLAITSEHALRFIMLSFLIGARNRVGYDAAGRGFLLNKKVEYPEYRNRDKLELEYYLDLIRALGISVEPKKEWMRLHFGNKEKKAAERFLRENRIGNNDVIVGIHAGGGIWKKRWPLFKFAKLADMLIQKYRARIIAFGGKEDVPLYLQMQKMMKSGLAVAAGEMNVLETAALLEHCKLVVANDSAVSHLAATTDAKVIALFGVDSPKRWGPFGNSYIMKHRRLPKCNLICNYDYLYAIDECFDENNPYCMNLITVEDVLWLCEKMLGGRRK